MAENPRRVEKSLSSHLLQKWNDLDLKNAAAPLLQFADKHPFITLFIGILTGLSILPLLLFATFVITTFMFTMLGFMLIEGTLLSIATFLLVITIFGVVCASIVLTTLLVIIWIVFATGNVGMRRLKCIVNEQVPQLREHRLWNQFNATSDKTS